MDRQELLNDFYAKNALELERVLSNFHRAKGSNTYFSAVNEILSFVQEGNLLKYPADKTYETWNIPKGFDVKGGYLKIVNPLDRYIVQDVKMEPIRVVFLSGSSKGTQKLKVFDVGNGEHLEDFPAESKGEAVVAEGNPSRVFRNARKIGVNCILLYYMRAQEPGVGRTPELLSEVINYNSFPAYSEGELFGFALTYREYKELKELTRRGLEIETRLDIDSGTNELEIIEVSLGEDNFPKPIILTAHLCHPKPGANDNASGAALLAEIVRVLRKFRLSRKIVALWIPEMYGTIAYLTDHNIDFAYGVNLDMVGENQNITGSYLDIVSPPWSLPSFIGELLSSNLENPGFKRNEGHYTGGSDHYIFDDSTVSVPFTSLTQWPDRFYHSSEDTVDKSSVESFEWIGIGVLNSIFDLSEGFDPYIFAKTKSRVISKYIENSLRSDLVKNWLAFNTHKSLEMLSSFGDVSQEIQYIENKFDKMKIPKRKNIKKFKGPLGDAWMKEKDEEWEIESQREESSFKDFTYELLNFLDLGFSVEDSVGISREEFGIQKEMKDESKYLIERLKEEKLLDL